MLINKTFYINTGRLVLDVTPCTKSCDSKLIVVNQEVSRTSLGQPRSIEPDDDTTAESQVDYQNITVILSTVIDADHQNCCLFTSTVQFASFLWFFMMSWPI